MYLETSEISGRQVYWETTVTSCGRNASPETNAKSCGPGMQPIQRCKSPSQVKPFWGTTQRVTCLEFRVSCLRKYWCPLKLIHFACGILNHHGTPICKSQYLNQDCWPSPLLASEGWPYKPLEGWTYETHNPKMKGNLWAAYRNL